MASIMASAGLDRSAPPRVLEGRVAVVTGSTSGIGLGIARALAGRGAMIILHGLCSAIEAEQLCRELGDAYDVPVGFERADMADSIAIAAMLERVARRFGPVDILVNNAGIQHLAAIEDFPPDTWDAIIAINLSAAFHGIRIVLPEMKRRGFGRIVNVASAHALVASPFKSAYVAATHGILGLTKVVALEAAAYGVTCNAVCPGVWTRLVEQQEANQAKVHGISTEEVVRKVFINKQPAGKFATVEQVAAAAAFFCDDAAASITGVALPVESGWTEH